MNVYTPDMNGPFGRGYGVAEQEKSWPRPAGSDDLVKGAARRQLSFSPTVTIRHIMVTSIRLEEGQVEPPDPVASTSTPAADGALIPPEILTLETGPAKVVEEDVVASESAATPPYSIWTKGEKWAIVILISVAGSLSPITANVYLPVIPNIAENLKATIEQLNLTVTWYTIVQGISPSLWGSLCDVLGRRPVFMYTYVLYVGASIGLAQTRHYWLLIFLRCLQAAGSGSSVAIGAGAIGDVAAPFERGSFMGVYIMGLVVGPCIGPIVGGLLSQYFGWHAVFWFTAAFGGALLVLVAIFLPETLRAMVGNGSIPATGINRTLLSVFRSRRQAAPLPTTGPPSKTRWRDVKPLTALTMFREKDVLITLTFTSVVWTLFVSVITSTSSSLKVVYNLSERSIGLCFLASGLGSWIAGAINGSRLDRDFRIVKEQLAAAKKDQVTEAGEKEEEAEKEKTRDENDLIDFPIEHARLRSLPFFLPIILGATIIYGWALQKKVHIALPIICQFFIGFGTFVTFNTASTLIVDLFPSQAGSATAANNLLRCLLGSVGTAVVQPLIEALGSGWAFTLLSGIVVLFTPLLWIEWKWGMGFRAVRAERLAREAVVAEERKRKKREERELQQAQ